MKSRISLLLASLLVALGGMLAIAAPAQAAVCNSGTFCVYDNAAGTVLLYAPRPANLPFSTCIKMPLNANNKAEYLRNRSDYYIIVFDSRTCDSTPGTVYPGTIGAMGSGWINSISSFYVDPTPFDAPEGVSLLSR